jgi:hypothetical protein
MRYSFKLQFGKVEPLGFMVRDDGRKERIYGEVGAQRLHGRGVFKDAMLSQSDELIEGPSSGSSD